MAELFQKKKTGPPKKEKNPESACDTNEVLNSSVSSSFNDNITDKGAKIKKKGKHSYTMESTMKTFSIKVYDEQLPKGLDDLKEKIGNIDKKEAHVLGIVHNRDYNHEDFFEPSVEKAHVHIIGRFLRSGRKLRTILNMLGVVYRKGLDDIMLQNHGVETINKFDNMALYLTHETDKAMLDGKARYDLEEIFSNLEIDEIREIRNGALRLTTSGKNADYEDMVELLKQARQLGENFEDFEEWYHNLTLAQRSSGKSKELEKEYQYGLKMGLEKNPIVNRLSVFIQGQADMGKTFAVKQFFKSKGLPTISIDAGGTGALDNLTVRTQAIIIDDATYKSLLRLSDNYVVQVSRRNRNNPYWRGSYFIIVSNDSFEDFMKKCGTDEDMTALKSRFYICKIEEDEYLKDNNLPYKSLSVLRDDKARLMVSTRGLAEDQQERLDKFMEFKKSVEDSLNSYNPKDNVVDYSVLLKG